jgi:hypothetical protein
MHGNLHVNQTMVDTDSLNLDLKTYAIEQMNCVQLVLLTGQF